MVEIGISLHRLWVAEKSGLRKWSSLQNNMRIWHEKLIPHLCRQHLLAVWREGLGAYSIITKGKKGYSNHPAVIEFKNAPWQLVKRLHIIRNEMLKRGYNPKNIISLRSAYLESSIKPWQTLKEQIERLKDKHCECKLNNI
jgi:uncharacterized protein (TIGR02328 family)